MTTQVTFRMDEELKKRAMAKAKKEGVSLKTIYLYLTQARLDGQMELGMQPVHRELVESPEDRAAWIQGRKDLENGDVVDGEEFLSSLLSK